MIGKLIKGRGARGLLEYLLGERDHSGEVRPRVEVLGGTLDGNDIATLTRQFAALHRLRPRLGVHVAHQCLRLAPEDRTLSDDEWREIGSEWAAGMGFDGYVIISHGNHIHIAASRIRADGSVVSDTHDWRRSETLIREIERRHGLVRVEASHLLEPERATTHRKAPTIAEIAMAERGEVPLAEQMRDILETALSKPRTVTEFVECLQTHGVQVLPNLASTGKLNGFAYEFQGQTFTANGLGRGFTWANLQKRGLTYEPSRDLEALRRCRARIAASAPGAGDGPPAAEDKSPAPDGSADVRRTGAGDAAPGGVDGAPRGGDAGGAERDADRSLTGARGTDGGSEGTADGRKQPQEVEATSPRTHVVDQRSNLPSGLGTDRLRDLAGVENRGVVLTTQQVRQQLEGLACERYEIGIIPPKGAPGRPQQRLWTGEQVLKGLRWLRRMNALNNDIYIRPAPRPDGQAEPLAFVDDLDATGLARVAADGHRWAALIESSPGRYHGWIRLAEQPLPRDVVTAAARDLAQRYGGDPASAHWRHYGRLAGLTNRKPARARPDGTAPFALLRSAWRGVTEAARRLLEAVRQLLWRSEQKPTRPALSTALPVPPAPSAPIPPAWQARWERSGETTAKRLRQTPPVAGAIPAGQRAPDNDPDEPSEGLGIPRL